MFVRVKFLPEHRNPLQVLFESMNDTESAIPNITGGDAMALKRSMKPKNVRSCDQLRTYDMYVR